MKFKPSASEQETEYSMPNKVETLEPSTIETIDLGIYRYVNENLDLSTTTNEGFKKTPVIWLGTDRLFQVKNNKELRDSVGKIKLPIITVNRDSIAKDPSFKGSFQAHLFENSDYKGGAITRVRRIQQEKTRFSLLALWPFKEPSQDTSDIPTE